MNHPAQGRLLQWAALFLFLQSVILSLSPAVRERSWDVDYKFSHWIGFFAWGALTYLIHRSLMKSLPERDVYIFPAASLLAGWGLLTVWRLDENFGLKQTAWLAISAIIFIALLRLPKDLSFLRNYKYIFLSAGLLITAETNAMSATNEVP